jgi:DNA-binding NarL/FixJ family response regulator
MIRILVADDHAIMREGLKQLFALERDISVVGPAEVREALLGLALQLVGWSQNSQNEYRSD